MRPSISLAMHVAGVDLSEIKLDPDVVRTWVTDLRSGIPQTQRVLGRSDGSRCCLGVLCDISVKAGVIEELIVSTIGSLTYDNYSTAPSIAVRQWATSAADEDEVDRMFSVLANQNDNGATFEEIASWLEATFLPPQESPEHS